VLATAATFQGELFASLMGRFGEDLEVVTRACAGWAEQVEKGQVDGPATRDLVATHLDPVLARGVDTLVLGCTHYPFLQSIIADRAGSQVVVIDPAPAVARQAAMLYNGRPGTPKVGTLEIRTTGDPSSTREVVARLTGIDQPVTPVTWPNR
jgi:glutamate racemase